jgi:hypothetical protein
MIEILTSAAFIFWFAIAAVITMAVLLEYEREGWATTIFSVGSALILWNYRESIINFVTDSPGTTFGFIGSYVAAGIIWSFIKWKNYVSSKTNKFYEVKKKFVDDGGDIKNDWKGWISFLNGNIGSMFYENWTPEEVVAKIIPQASEKKSLITSWISYWPASLGATLLNNPFRRFFEWIYSLVSGIYDKIGSSAAKDMVNGLEKAQPVTKQKEKEKELLKS